MKSKRPTITWALEDAVIVIDVPTDFLPTIFPVDKEWEFLRYYPDHPNENTAELWLTQGRLIKIVTAKKEEATK